MKPFFSKHKSLFQQSSMHRAHKYNILVQKTFWSIASEVFQKVGQFNWTKANGPFKWSSYIAFDLP